MNAYVKAILITVIICNLVLILVPEWSGDGIKKHVKYLCGLAVLLTLLTPLTTECQDGDAIEKYAEDFFNSDVFRQDAATEEENSTIEKAARETAYAVILYIAQKYNIDSNNVSITVITSDDAQKITELQIYLYNSPEETEMEIIRQDIANMTGTTVFVFGGNRA